jgi:hypothetical protein
VAEHGFFFTQLTPIQTLNILAGLGSDVRLLHDMGAGLATKSVGGYLTLVVPDFYVRNRSKASKNDQENVFNRLGDIFNQITKGRIHTRQNIQKNLLPLAETAIWCLLKSGGSDSSIQAKVGEWLVIASKVSTTRQAKLVEDIRFHATFMRLAIDTKSSRLLIHVQDEKRRGSSFPSLVAGLGLADCQLLSAFEVDKQRIFLPQNSAPSLAGLRNFRRLYLTVPELFGLDERNQAASLLLAIGDIISKDDESPESDLQLRIVIVTKTGSQQEEENSITPLRPVYPLDHLDFIDQSAITPPASDYAEIKIFNLKSTQQAIEKLAEEIKNAEPEVGYKLELRQGYQQDDAEAKRITLMEQMSELENQLAYLNSVYQPKPLLLRFTQSQLPALADAIRSFPASDVGKGYIRYAFQATDINPKGWHYLWFDPSATVMTEPYPLWRWTNLDHFNMRFGLDHFWARYYLDVDQDCLVFVPEGMTLFPALHSWDTENMSQYMREMMARWFHGQASVPELPKYPIYIFDEDQNTEGNINIQVLDRDAFKPLDKQIGWLTDNLVVHNKIDIENYIRQMAGDIGWMQLSQNVATVRKKREAAFMKDAAISSDKIAEEFNQLTTVLTEEIARIQQESEMSLDEIKKLHKQLSHLNTVCKKLKSTHTKIQTATKQGKKTAADTQVTLDDMLKDINNQILTAEKTWTDIEDNINSTIKKLNDTRDSLQQTLKNIW